MILTTNLAASRFHETVRKDVLSDIETGSWWQKAGSGFVSDMASSCPVLLAILLAAPIKARGHLTCSESVGMLKYIIDSREKWKFPSFSTAGLLHKPSAGKLISVVIFRLCKEAMNKSIRSHRTCRHFPSLLAQPRWQAIYMSARHHAGARAQEGLPWRDCQMPLESRWSSHRHVSPQCPRPTENSLQLLTPQI